MGTGKEKKQTSEVSILGDHYNLHKENAIFSIPKSKVAHS